MFVTCLRLILLLFPFHTECLILILWPVGCSDYVLILFTVQNVMFIRIAKTLQTWCSILSITKDDDKKIRRTQTPACQIPNKCNAPKQFGDWLALTSPEFLSDQRSCWYKGVPTPVRCFVRLMIFQFPHKKEPVQGTFGLGSAYRRMRVYLCATSSRGNKFGYAEDTTNLTDLTDSSGRNFESYEAPRAVNVPLPCPTRHRHSQSATDKTITTLLSFAMHSLLYFTI